MIAEVSKHGASTTFIIADTTNQGSATPSNGAIARFV
jgi:hypothetical protein